MSVATGQTYFDFDAVGEDDATLFAEGVQYGLHDLCDEALALEELGKLGEAADIYQRALELNPEHATLHFDLGIVLFRLDRSQDSIGHFREAVRCDAEFAMAWHNLGSVHAHLGDWDAADAALRSALGLVPTYADSHFTLAEVMCQQGRTSEAAKHQKAYLKYSKADCVHATPDLLLRVVHADDAEQVSI